MALNGRGRSCSSRVWDSTSPCRTKTSSPGSTATTRPSCISTAHSSTMVAVVQCSLPLSMLVRACASWTSASSLLVARYDVIGYPHPFQSRVWSSFVLLTGSRTTHWGIVHGTSCASFSKFDSTSSTSWTRMKSAIRKGHFTRFVGNHHQKLLWVESQDH